MGNNPVSTVVDVVTDNRSYYNCPRCGKRVWAYGSFKGNVCFDCPGTVISAVGSSVNMITCDITDSQPQQMANFVASEVTQTVSAVGGVIGNVVTLNIVSDGNGTKAKYTPSAFRISKGNVTESLSSSYASESILSITSKSIGIRAEILNGTGVDHWWMVISTSSKYYNIQFQESGSQIVLRRCDSIDECDQSGLAEANRDENISPKTESSWSKSGVKGRTLGDLVSWLESGGMSSTYSLYNNNCQDLCKNIYRWI